MLKFITFFILLISNSTFAVENTLSTNFEDSWEAIMAILPNYDTKIVNKKIGKVVFLIKHVDKNFVAAINLSKTKNKSLKLNVTIAYPGKEFLVQEERKIYEMIVSNLLKRSISSTINKAPSMLPDPSFNLND